MPSTRTSTCSSWVWQSAKRRLTRNYGSPSYIDLTGSMTIADKYTLRLGINNLFDKDPPLNGGSSCPTGPCNGNTWPQVYDALGRQIFGLVTIDF